MSVGTGNAEYKGTFSVAAFYRLMILVAVSWTLIIGTFFLWQRSGEREHTLALAKKEARANFDKDQAFRFWATRHGGVYVPANERTPPNPHLAHIPERDIVTPHGRQLTLMNPAYMLRQMMGEYDELYGVKGRITSLKPLNPRNAPDDWERSALVAFERGAGEIFEVTEIEDQPYLRLMRPMPTKAGCLKCHAHQGYKVGDIRGGVGVAVPLREYLALEANILQKMMLTHGGVWILGLAGIWVVSVRGGRRIRAHAVAEEAMRESEARFRAVFDNAADGIFVHDSGGRFVDANRRACESLGYTREELLGMSVSDIDMAWSLERGMDAWSELPDDAPAALGDGIHRRKDGTSFPVDVRASRMRHGGRDLIVAVAHDMTEHNEARAALERSNEELQQFAYVASHDLQEPLRTITTYVQLLEHRYEGKLDQDAYDFIGFAADAAKRMRNLIQDLLSYSRIETQAGALVPVQINEILDEALSNLKGLADEAEAKVRRTELPKVVGDGRQLVSLFQNLIGNAIKYRAPDRRPTISIGAQRVDGIWMFHVRDNGIGIEPQYADRVFKVFQRLHTQAHTEGTGIGLAVARRIVSRHGGRIWLESEPGKGSVFFFTLPAADGLPDD